MILMNKSRALNKKKSMAFNIFNSLALNCLKLGLIAKATSSHPLIRSGTLLGPKMSPTNSKK